MYENTRSFLFTNDSIPLTLKFEISVSSMVNKVV